jgi:hypothetical protein
VTSMNPKGTEPQPNLRRKAHLSVFQKSILVLVIVFIVICAIIFNPFSPKTQTETPPEIMLGVKCVKSDDYNWTAYISVGRISAIKVHLVISDPNNGNVTLNSLLVTGNIGNPDFTWNDHGNDKYIDAGDNLTLFGIYTGVASSIIKQGYRCSFIDGKGHYQATWLLP